MCDFLIVYGTLTYREEILNNSETKLCFVVGYKRIFDSNITFYPFALPGNNISLSRDEDNGKIKKNINLNNLISLLIGPNNNKLLDIDFFTGLITPVSEKQLLNYDYYEGVYSGLYYRKLIDVIVINKIKDIHNYEIKKGYIYLPTQETVESYGLNTLFQKDNDDSWLKELRKKDELIKKYPELLFDKKKIIEYLANLVS